MRPILESSIVEFSQSFDATNWPLMMDGLSSSEMVDIFQKMTTDLQDIHFPLKKITVTQYDRPWFTEELRIIRRQRQKIYRKEGRSAAYIEVKRKFDEKLKNEASKFIKKIHQEVSEGKRGSSYSAIRKLGNKDFDDPKGSNTFDIPEFVDNNLNENDSAEALADFFSAISQEFLPLDPDRFPPNIKAELERGAHDQEVPQLNEYEVFEKIRKAKKPHSTVPGDLKRVLVKECSAELVTPVTLIYNQITSTKEFPRSWVVEQQTPIPKTKPVASLDDIRNISGTPFFSKQYESFLSDWHLPIVRPFLDPGQCGGLKKSSISHYLVKLLHYIHFNLDKTVPLLGAVDMSKSFDKMSHQQGIEDQEC